MATIRKTWNENNIELEKHSNKSWFNLFEDFSTMVSETKSDDSILSVHLETKPFYGVGALCLKTLCALFPDFEMLLIKNAFGNMFVWTQGLPNFSQQQKEQAVSEFMRLRNLGWLHLKGDEAFVSEIEEKLRNVENTINNKGRSR